MPLLRNGRLSAEDPWVRLADDEPLPFPASGAASAPAVLGLARFLDEAARGSAAGVLVAPDDDVLALEPHLGRLQLVAIDFPAYTDGRGYSQARLLRRRLGFGGEIRAVGDVRVDQLAFMMRAGFDAFDLVDAPDEQTLRQALSRYRTSYQPSYTLPIAG